MLIATEDAEIKFYNQIREFVILFLFFIALQLCSYVIISIFRERTVYDITEYDEALAEKLTIWICVFSFNVTIGALSLLPISIISNEILLMYPNSYYIAWLNSSLIADIWNIIFFVSHVVIFFLLPFAFFFYESEGYANSPKGIKAKAHEALITLFLLAVLAVGFIFVFTMMMDGEFSVSIIFPVLHSVVSYVGVALLLSCTPMGFAQLFTMIGSKLVKPKVPECIKNENNSSVVHENELDWKKLVKGPYINALRNKSSEEDLGFSSFFQDERPSFESKSFENTFKKKVHEKPFRRHTILFLLLLVLTVVAVLIVFQNMFALCFGVKTLPMYPEEFSLGNTSLSVLGPVGAFFEVILIMYLWCSSVIGMYSMPLLCHLKPKLKDTSTVLIIGNVLVLIITSCAFPKLVRSLGMTNFDLPGSFGKTYWMRSFRIVLFFNVIFAVATLICLGTKITSAIRKELAKRLLLLARKNYPSDDEPPLPSSPTRTPH